MTLETIARDLDDAGILATDTVDVFVPIRKADADLLIGLARKVGQLDNLWDQAYDDDVVLVDALDEMFAAWDLLQELS
jgi:hypothetical protein